jgi:hypothetical protein
VPTPSPAEQLARDNWEKKRRARAPEDSLRQQDAAPEELPQSAPPAAETISLAEETARENWERKRKAQAPEDALRQQGTAPEELPQSARSAAETIIAEETARKNWERGRKAIPTTAEETMIREPRSAEMNTASREKGQERKAKKPKGKIFWTSIWVAGVTSVTSVALENYIG